ncbi:hypothetical protein JZ751_030016 [Albula glossodonta]|uniref:Uncharacterized protein n=1 Tax=Albula glossodonta TaxID=121402 RepID=A0A8T2MQ67_9TELE|nr:hypothetical protein JZ751_030016 [Albula glossodonta]
MRTVTLANGTPAALCGKKACASLITINDRLCPTAASLAKKIPKFGDAVSQQRRQILGLRAESDERGRSHSEACPVKHVFELWVWRCERSLHAGGSCADCLDGTQQARWRDGLVALCHLWRGSRLSLWRRGPQGRQACPYRALTSWSLVAESRCVEPDLILLSMILQLIAGSSCQLWGTSPESPARFSLCLYSISVSTFLAGTVSPALYDWPPGPPYEGLAQSVSCSALRSQVPTERLTSVPVQTCAGTASHRHTEEEATNCRQRPNGPLHSVLADCAGFSPGQARTLGREKTGAQPHAAAAWTRLACKQCVAVQRGHRPLTSLISPNDLDSIGGSEVSDEGRDPYCAQVLRQRPLLCSGFEAETLTVLRQRPLLCSGFEAETLTVVRDPYCAQVLRQRPLLCSGFEAETLTVVLRQRPSLCSGFEAETLTVLRDPYCGQVLRQRPSLCSGFEAETLTVLGDPYCAQVLRQRPSLCSGFEAETLTVVSSTSRERSRVKSSPRVKSSRVKSSPRVKSSRVKSSPRVKSSSRPRPLPCCIRCAARLYSAVFCVALRTALQGLVVAPRAAVMARWGLKYAIVGESSALTNPKNTERGRESKREGERGAERTGGGTERSRESRGRERDRNGAELTVVRVCLLCLLEVVAFL